MGQEREFVRFDAEGFAAKVPTERCRHKTPKASQPVAGVSAKPTTGKRSDDPCDAGGVAARVQPGRGCVVRFRRRRRRNQ